MAKKKARTKKKASKAKGFTWKRKGWAAVRGGKVLMGAEGEYPSLWIKKKNAQNDVDWNGGEIRSCEIIVKVKAK